MRKTILMTLMLFVVNCAVAQLNGNGYYRVQNVQTQRFIRVIDNKGSVNLATTNADLGALETVKPFERVVSDPASIIYIEKASDGYNLKAQGTSSYSIIKYYVKLRAGSGNTYRAYAQDGGLVKYLRDENTTYDEGIVLTADGNPRDWYIKPVNQTDGQYFAFKPDITVNNVSYATIYASFPFTITSSSMKAYYISKVADGQAVYKEVVNGKVPASTAVFVKCASVNYVDNKVTVENNGVSTLSGNLLNGVYFKNTTNKHKNLKEYDPKTMRVLGVMSNGELGFVTANYDYLPANKAYLVVPAGSPSEIKIVSEADFKPTVKVQSVTLSQQSLTMYAGESATLTATVLPAEANDKSVAWASSNEKVVTVDANGAVKAVGYGKATITVTSVENSAAKATCEVQVYEHSIGVQLSATSLEMYVGENATLTAQTLPLSTSDGRLEWKSSNEKVVTVDANGAVKAVGYGKATITVTSVENSAAKATCEVQVYEHSTGVQLSATSLEMYVGENATLTAQTLPLSTSDGRLEWKSSDEKVVTVDANGAVKAVGYGKATITVTSVENSVAKATCEVQVYEHCTGVQLSATSLEMYVGENATLTAQTLPLSTSDGRMEWKSSNEKIVKLESEGILVAVSVGQADITVRSLDGGHVAICSVTVKEESAIEDIVSNADMSYKIYNLNGLEYKTLQKGVNIVRFENGIVKKIVIP